MKRLETLLLLAGLILVLPACRMAHDFRRDAHAVPVVCNDPLPAAPGSAPFFAQGNMVFDGRFATATALVLVEWDGSVFQIAALSPAGAKAFELRGTGEKVEKYYFIPGFFPGDPEKNAKVLPEIFQRMFPASYGKDTHRFARTGNTTHCVSAEGAGWEAEFFRYKGRIPVEIVYDVTGFLAPRMILRITEVQE
ncbi:MAG: hypothetical protein IKB22_00375 [Lentisphaeria bacterium]|nr:hypothetical protein [Lentisphaeria bacterium]